MLNAHAIVLTLFLSAPLGAQEPTDIVPLLRERVNAAATAGIDEVWRSSLILTSAAGESGRAALDAAVDAMLAPSESPTEHAVLLLAQVRLSGTEPDVTQISQRLMSLLDSKDDAVAHGAALLLADRNFRLLKDEDRTKLIEKLSAVAKNGDHSPRLRIAAALALYLQGGGAAQREARSTLGEFLSASDASLRALGALALAQTGDTETARSELEHLAAIPDENGRLAAAYLKQDELRRSYDRMTRKVAASADSTKPVELKGDPGQRRIEQLIRVIEKYSLEGEKKKREDLIDAALDGMMRSLDEHSSYLPPKAYKEFVQDLLSPEYGGIGAYVGEDPDDHLFTIRQPIYSGPAYRAGLHSDDKIIRIDDWPTFTPQGMRPVDDIIKRLKGKPGTKVKLYVWRRGMDPALIDRPTEEMAVEIVREEITIPPVKADLLPGGIAYVELTTFSKVASEELSKKLREFQGQGLKGVILDLRQNTGGLLSEAVNVANLFLPPKKLIVSTVSRTQDPKEERTHETPLIADDVPVAVLISRFSASASEIVSGALQDYRRATVVGQRSYGKGSVQSLLPIPGESDDEFDDENDNGIYDPGEKLTRDYNGNGEFDFGPRARTTIARYLLPSGRSIHREFDEKGDVTSEGGVEPDVKADPRRFESWKIEEFNRIMKTRKIRDYLDANYPKNRELFRKLASSDLDDTSLYPGFDDLYESLETTLSKQDVRFLLRREVRGRAQDDRGAAFPEGDFEEDPMLQSGIRVVLEKLGVDLASVPAYQKTFDKNEKSTDKVALANLTDSARTDLRHALTLIDQAKGGAALSADRLNEIEKALQSILDR